MSTLFGGGSSGSSGLDLSGIGNALSGAMSGVGNAFSGGASSVGDLLSSVGSAMNAASSPAQQSTALQNAIDPSGTISAQQALNPPGAGTPEQQAADVGGTQSDQSGTSASPQQQQPQQPTEDDRASRAGGDAIRRLIQQLRGESGQQDPYRPGGTEAQEQQWESEGGAQGRPGPSDRLGLRPGSGQQFQPKWGGGPGEPPVDLPGGSPEIGQAISNAARAQGAGQAAVEGAVGAPPEAPAAPQAAVSAPAAAPVAPTAEAAPAAAPAAPTGISGGGPSIPQAVAGLLPRLLSTSNPFIAAAGPAMYTTPADTGEQPYGGYTSPPSPAKNFMGQPYPEVQREGEGGPAREELPHDPTGKAPTKDEYKKFLKDQGYSDSEAKKKADKSKPEERKRHPKKGDEFTPVVGGAGPHAVPTLIRPEDRDPKRPLEPGERPYHTDARPPGQSNIVRDAAGMGGVPQMLGQLAQLAIPMMMGAFAGGGGGGGPFGGRHGFGGFPFGRGGHGRFGGGRGFMGGHPGGFGSGMWPYHHPGMGWQGFGHHPGGGWRPLNPAFGPQGERWGGGGGGGDQTAQAILQALTGGGQQGQGGQPGQGQGQGGPPGGQGGAPGQGQGGGQGGQPRQGPWSSNPFLSTLVGAESGGNNNAVGDNGLARGVFQIHPGTWTEYASRVPGASQYSSPEQAPPEVQQQVAMQIPIEQFGDRTRAMLHRRFGDFKENLTVGQLAQQFGGGAGTQTAGGQPATTPTGDSKTPQGSSPQPQSPQDASGGPVAGAPPGADQSGRIFRGRPPPRMNYPPSFDSSFQA